nr:transposase [Nocardia sp. SYP-A9097]
MLAEFGDDPDRFSSAKARKNFAGTSPITRASGKKTVVMARFVHNDRLIDALGRQAAFCAERGKACAENVRAGWSGPGEFICATPPNW